MSSDPRQVAIERAEDLQHLLESSGDPASVAAAHDQCTHLVRAIHAFHMEAIRFRMFTLDRLIASGAVLLDERERSLVGELKDALEAAGFHTRSHKAP
jgi:hypothetical protein